MGRGQHTLSGQALRRNRRPAGLSAIRRQLHDGQPEQAIAILAAAGATAFERPGCSALMIDLARSQAQTACHQIDPAIGSMFDQLDLSPTATARLATTWLNGTQERLLAHVQRTLWEEEDFTVAELERLGRQAKTAAFLNAVAEIAASDRRVAASLLPQSPELPVGEWRRALHRSRWWQPDCFVSDLAADYETVLSV